MGSKQNKLCCTLDKECFYKRAKCQAKQGRFTVNIGYLSCCNTWTSLTWITYTYIISQYRLIIMYTLSEVFTLNSSAVGTTKYYLVVGTTKMNQSALKLLSSFFQWFLWRSKQENDRQISNNSNSKNVLCMFLTYRILRVNIIGQVVHDFTVCRFLDVVDRYRATMCHKEVS